MLEGGEMGCWALWCKMIRIEGNTGSPEINNSPA